MAYSRRYKRRGGYRKKGRGRAGRRRGAGTRASRLGRQLKSVAASSLKLQRSMQTHQAGQWTEDLTGDCRILPLNATNINSDAGTFNEDTSYGHIGWRTGSSILLKRMQLDIEMIVDTAEAQYTGKPFRARVLIVKFFNDSYIDMSNTAIVQRSLFEYANDHIGWGVTGFRRTNIRGQTASTGMQTLVPYKVIYDKMLMFTGNRQFEVIRFGKRFGLGKEPVIKYANAAIHSGVDMFEEAPTTGWNSIRNGYWLIIQKETTSAGVFQLKVNCLNDYCP